MRRGRTTLVFILLITKASIASETVPLFSERELKELEYLISNQRLVDVRAIETIEDSRRRMKSALKLYAMRDQRLRRAYFKKDIWAQEDQRENYFSLMRWLERISPLSKEKKNKKETK